MSLYRSNLSIFQVLKELPVPGLGKNLSFQLRFFGEKLGAPQLLQLFGLANLVPIPFNGTINVFFVSNNYF